MNPSHNVIIVGLPDSGKTNYIVRFWLALRQNSNILRCDGLPDDLEYLEAGGTELLGGDFAPHTPHEVNHHAIIPITYTASSNQSGSATLTVPDYSGEAWEEIYRRRSWSETWEESIDKTCGFLLFIRADSDHTTPSLDWITAGKYFGTPEQLERIVQTNQQSVTPSAVIMVDWIQFFRKALTEKVGGTFKPKLGVVVSAWDAVPEDQREQGPDAYVEMNYPLLKQFLDSNADQFEVGFFGVSIVGGDLKDVDGFRNTYLDSGINNSGYVVYRSDSIMKGTKDLTYPVAWALGIRLTEGGFGE
jgi:hypothetical protein